MVAESAYTLEELIVLCSHRLQFRFLRKVSAKHSEREVQVTQTDEEEVDVSVEAVKSRRPVGAVPVPFGRPDRVIIIGNAVPLGHVRANPPELHPDLVHRLERQPHSTLRELPTRL